MEDQRGMVSRPGRVGAFTGNDVEDLRRIIHGYAKDLEESEERVRQLQAQLATMREALERLTNIVLQDFEYPWDYANFVSITSGNAIAATPSRAYANRVAGLERLYDAVSHWHWRHGLIDKQTGLDVSSIACTYPAVWRLATTFDQLEAMDNANDRVGV